MNTPIFKPLYALQAQEFTNNYLANVNATVSPTSDYMVCPVGLLMLLSTLLGSGATAGTTAYQLGEALNLQEMGTPEEAYEEATELYKGIFESLKTEVSKTSNGSIYNVPMASALITDEGYTINADFQNSLTKNFDASIYQTNFNHPYETMELANGWAYEKSYGRIPHLFTSPAEIKPETKLMLLNIFAFKDNWMATFPKPTPGIFFSNPLKPIRMPMMTLLEPMPYVHDKYSGYSAIKKPMRNPRFSFVVVLPDKPRNFKAIDHVLYGTKSVRQLFSNGNQNEFVKLTLPKFHMQMKVNMIPVAKLMGITALFNPYTADLSGITDDQELVVNMLEQASVLKVDEYGVEAIAATYSSAVPTSLFEPVQFKVNRPFGCMIYDEELDMPLMVAKVFHPRT